MFLRGCAFAKPADTEKGAARRAMNFPTVFRVSGAEGMGSDESEHGEQNHDENNVLSSVQPRARA